MLLNSSRNYFYTFLIISSIPFFLILLDQINDYRKQLRINELHTWLYQLETQKIEIWENINNSKRVEQLLSNTKTSKLDNFNDYEIFKASIYFGLFKNDENYYTKYEQFIEDNDLNKCDIIEEVFKFHIPKTEEDYLQIFKALDNPHQGLNFCIPFNQDLINRDDFYFETLYAKGYKKAALQALNKKTENPNYYIEQFKKINDLDYRNKAFVILIGNTDFSNFRLKDFYTLILEQKKDDNFENYLALFAKKLNTLNLKKEEFVNQEGHPFFMELYQLLGGGHSFIKAFPKEYISKQIAYQKETEGKPFIQFTQFFSQAVSLEHLHSKEGFYFYIKHNNKLIYKGVSNKYGCVSYKSYNLKPTDVIEVSLDYFRLEMQFGWQQLLPAWNTEDGTKERFYAMGYNPEYENIYQKYGNGKTTFSLEIAKKVKEDFDNYFDKKWQE